MWILLENWNLQERIRNVVHSIEKNRDILFWNAIFKYFLSVHVNFLLIQGKLNIFIPLVLIIEESTVLDSTDYDEIVCIIETTTCKKRENYSASAEEIPSTNKIINDLMRRLYYQSHVWHFRCFERKCNTLTEY